MWVEINVDFSTHCENGWFSNFLDAHRNFKEDRLFTWVYKKNQTNLQIQLMMKHSYWIICLPYHQEQGPVLPSFNATVIPASPDHSSVFTKKKKRSGDTQTRKSPRFPPPPRHPD